MSGLGRSTAARDAALLAGAAVAYWLAARIGLEFRTEPEKFAIFWPPNGLLAGFLLVARRGQWPYLLGVAAAIMLGVNLAEGLSWPVSAGFVLVNVGESLLLAWLLGRARGTPYSITSVGDVFLLYAAAAGACAASAVAGAAVVVYGLGAESYPAVWRAFWLSDAMGIMLVAPVVVAWTGPDRPALEGSPARVAEAAVLAAGVLALVALVAAYPGGPDGRLIVLRLPALPLFLWAALRFGPPATAAVVLVLALSVVWNTGHGQGVFANPAVSTTERLLTVQFFLCVVGLCSLGLAALSADRRAALAALSRSEERYRQVTDTMEEVFWVVSPATGRVEYVSPGYRRVWGREPDAGPAPPELLAGADGPHEAEYQVVRPDGSTRWVHTRTYPLRDDGGRVWRVVGITQDVTDRKEAEQAKEAVIGELQQALAEIKTLRGLVPICAWCKKIRDDAGFWQQLEVYLGRHTDARFSHGICPSCFAEQEQDSGLSPGD